MYESSIAGHLTVKYMSLVLGMIFLVLTLFFIFDPSIQITINGEKRDAVFIDSFIPGIFCLLFFVIYFFVGRRVVRIKMNNNHISFKWKGKMVKKSWAEVDSVKRYWMVAPPLYSLKFENETTTFFFNTRYLCIIIPFYVFDISKMGKFITDKMKEISFLKDFKKEELN